jgi:hypothetical protein
MGNFVIHNLVLARAKSFKQLVSGARATKIRHESRIVGTSCNRELTSAEAGDRRHGEKMDKTKNKVE